VEDVKRLVRESITPSGEFQELEKNLIFYIMLASLRKENFSKFGIDAQIPLSDEQKEALITSLTDEQRNIIKRDFIIKHISDTFGNKRQSHLLLEFAILHFPDKVKKIKELHSENYAKKHIRIKERISQLQPYVAETHTEEAAVVSEEK